MVEHDVQKWNGLPKDFGNISGRSSMRRLFAIAIVLAAAVGVLRIAQAGETYPVRTVRLILPFGAASATDITARLLVAFLGARDDHTLFFGPASTFLVHLYDEEKPPYDPRDVMPIAQVYVTVLAISVPMSLNVGTMDELIALARAQPGKLNAAAATGNSDFLSFGFIKSMGLQIAKVPYRDIMQAPNDLAEDRIQILSSSLAVAQPMMRAGRIKVLLVTSKRRALGAPELPTAAEAGYPALTMETAGGLFGPPQMPPELRESIAGELRKIAEDDPIIGQRLADTGQIMTLRGPADFARSVAEQNDQLAAIAKIIGLKGAQK
jgi:tripartite-type tricarboxylate transporter receptor subunit TctC